HPGRPPEAPLGLGILGSQELHGFQVPGAGVQLAGAGGGTPPQADALPGCGSCRFGYSCRDMGGRGRRWALMIAFARRANAGAGRGWASMGSARLGAMVPPPPKL